MPETSPWNSISVPTADFNVLQVSGERVHYASPALRASFALADLGASRSLKHQKCMSRLLSHLRVRPRLIGSMVVGIVAGTVMPGTYSAVTRSLLGWNVAAWLYLALMGVMMWRSDHTRLRRVAVAQAERAVAVLTVVVLAVFASLAGIVIELARAKVAGTPHAIPHVAFRIGDRRRFVAVDARLVHPDVRERVLAHGARRMETACDFRTPRTASSRSTPTSCTFRSPSRWHRRPPMSRC